MLTLERVDDVEVEMLEALPPFSTCARDDIEVFVAHDVMRMRRGAGEVLCGLAEDHNLYVLVSGSAELRVGPDLSIDLEPGDYFGRYARRYHGMAGTVVAVTDVEVLVIGPQDLGRLAVPGRLRG
jgi:CRP-like cAMP-binding protein